MSTKPTIFIIGGTGAQGIPVIIGLVQDGAYAVRVLTRDPNSRRAKHLLTLSPDVSLIPGTFTSEADLRAGFQGCWGAFINIDGFATGEAMETFWTYRCYELAIECGIKFYVHGNLDYGYKLGGYDARFRCGHYDGKGRMGEWILSQNASNKKRMKAALFTTGPYIEMALAPFTPMAPRVEVDEASGEQVVTWRVPLGEKGGVPHVSLDDCAYYVRWLFDNPERADGMNLAVAVDHIHYSEVASAFEKVTGHKAKHVDVDLEMYFSTGHWGMTASLPTGYTVDSTSPALMNLKDNFTGFWKLWQGSGSNQGVVKRDYALLDEIHPNRIKSVEEFFRREDDKAKADGRGSLWEAVANPRPILKIHQDGSLRSAQKGRM